MKFEEDSVDPRDKDIDEPEAEFSPEVVSEDDDLLDDDLVVADDPLAVDDEDDEEVEIPLSDDI